MYCGARLLRHWAERLRSDSQRAEKRQLRRVMLRVRGLAVAIKTVTTVMEAVQLVATALTRCESMQRSWLQKVSIRAKIEEPKMGTHQCHPGHPPVPQDVRTETLNVNIDADESKSNLQKSANPKRRKQLTRDVPRPLSHAETLQGVA